MHERAFIQLNRLNLNTVMEHTFSYDVIASKEFVRRSGIFHLETNSPSHGISTNRLPKGGMIFRACREQHVCQWRG